MSALPTIIVIAYNRPVALQGLLNSLQQAQYPVGGQVNLVISIDHSGEELVKQVAGNFNWQHGQKELIVHSKRLGLYEHVLSCGDLSEQYGPVIILEDDLEVSPVFYQYATRILDKYGAAEQLAGLSLYSYQLAETSLKPVYRVADGHPVYLMQYPSSWGQMFTSGQWAGFRNWLKDGGADKEIDVPPFVRSWSSGSWKKDYLKYLLDKGMYFLYPKRSYSTNMGYKGENFSIELKIFQVSLAQEIEGDNYPDMTVLSAYDEYFEVLPKQLSNLLNTSIDVVDVYGAKKLTAGMVLSSKENRFANPLKQPDIWEIPPSEALYLDDTENYTTRLRAPKVEEVALSMAISNGEVADQKAARQAFLLSYRFQNYLNVLRKRLNM